MPEQPVLIDFESRSRADLKSVGGRRYWADPFTEAFCCAWYDTRDESVGVWYPGRDWPHRGRQLCAHNMMHFDRFGAVRYGWATVEQTRGWADSSQWATRAGYAAALDDVGVRIAGQPKDHEASRYTRGLSTLKRPDGVRAKDWNARDEDEQAQTGVFPPVDLQRVVDYNCSDVVIQAVTFDDLAPWGEFEPDVEWVDRVINDRGVHFDVDLARALLACDERNKAPVLEAQARRMGDGWDVDRLRTACRSPKQFREFTGLPDAKKETVAAALLAGGDHPLLLARKAMASIAAGKLQAGLARQIDGVLYDTHVYCGAHTWRWSSRGVQLHNMPRPHKRFEHWTADMLCRAADRVISGKLHATPVLIDALLRACITASPGNVLVVEDFSGVEARMLAWLAGDQPALDVFRAGRDPYAVAAMAVFGGTYEENKRDKSRRAIGKILELACGYGQGGGSFYDFALKTGVELHSRGLNEFELVAAWRKQHAATVKYWGDLEAAMLAVLDGTTTQVGAVTVCPSSDGRDACIWLPSGRPIVYRQVHYAEVTDDDGRKRRGVRYRGRDGWAWLYGGLIAENVTQAICRDLLADALVRAERAGLNPVLHVHDEPVCDVAKSACRSAAAELHSVMTRYPSWAAGFPGTAAGFTSERYHK